MSGPRDSAPITPEASLNSPTMPAQVEHSLRHRTAFLWLNEHWQPLEQARVSASLTISDVQNADRKLRRFAGVLAELFPELRDSAGLIESPLLDAERFAQRMLPGEGTRGRWFIKADHALPVAGSIKARGGLYEVLLHAEALAIREGIMSPEGDGLALASPAARDLFAQHEIAVGSTGNLGLGIGVMASALGFNATVHMSSDAKEWKKTRLRARGVTVIEHEGDFGAAVAAGREQSQRNSRSYFVDDENSASLFLGYSVAAVRLQQQLLAREIAVDADHPLFVYLPCGVGGAPGGITFGLRHLLGDVVHCFFAEPVAAPCMLVRLAAATDAPVSVRDVGLDNVTEADGLAVGQASEFVVPLVRPLVSGLFTTRDADLLKDLYRLEESQGLRIEPSAAAGFRGPQWILQSEAGSQYLARRGIVPEQLARATHILWTTGGSLMPEEEYRRFHARGRRESDLETGC